MPRKPDAHHQQHRCTRRKKGQSREGWLPVTNRQKEPIDTMQNNKIEGRRLKQTTNVLQYHVCDDVFVLLLLLLLNDCMLVLPL